MGSRQESELLKTRTNTAQKYPKNTVFSQNKLTLTKTAQTDNRKNH